MAICHISIKIISRGKGKSAVAAAAYRSGEKITNDYGGITHDYTRKSGVIHSEIMLPENAPFEYSDRSILWNSVEKIEKAINSQLAREVEIALPIELTADQNLSLVRGYVKKNFIQHGMCADFAIHDTGNGNPHAHIMLTMRPLNKDKTWGLKEKKGYALDENSERIPIIDSTTGLQKVDGRNRKQWKREYVQVNDWNNRANSEDWRKAWADEVNAFLLRENHSVRVDHRSYKRQGKEQIPTIHLGVAASQMEQKGIPTDKGNRNREIVHANKILSAIGEKLKQLKDWLKDTIIPTVNDVGREKKSIIARLEKYKAEIKETQNAPPVPATQTLLETIQNILQNREQRGYSQGFNIAKVAKLNHFMQENNISTLPELRDKVSELQEQVIHAKQNHKDCDMRLKRRSCDSEWDMLISERRKAYDKYSVLKRKAESAEKICSTAEIIMQSGTHRNQSKQKNYESR